MGVIIELIQGQTKVFAEQMQGQHLYVLEYSVSVFGNSANIFITILGSSGHSNKYQTTITITHNTRPDYFFPDQTIFFGLDYSLKMLDYIIQSF
jgi:hypothetical protein